MSIDWKSEQFGDDESAPAFDFAVHIGSYTALWRGGSIIWYFNRHEPAPYSPTQALGSEVLVKDWTQGIVPDTIYAALAKYVSEKKRGG